MNECKPLVVGLSCDFSLHLAEAYSHSTFHGRGNRGVDAVTRVGQGLTLVHFSAQLKRFLCDRECV